MSISRQSRLPLAKRARRAPASMDAHAVVATAMMSFNVSVTQIHKILDKTCEGHAINGEMLDNEFQKYSSMVTPYCTVGQEIKSQGLNGPITVYANNPFALVYAARAVNHSLVRL